MKDATMIPAFDHRGVVPPFIGLPTNNVERSPYRVRLVDAVLRFSVSAERCKILSGFLAFRAALHAAGVIQGFQWLDGSFLENVEVTRLSPPQDIDVVSFYRPPSGMDEAAFSKQFRDLLSPNQNKQRFSVDAYAVSLNLPAELLVSQTAYWYSVWAHRRVTLEWKGFVEIDLAPMEDAEAQALLATQAGGFK